MLDFNEGDRVQLHPATDAWMRGDKFGEVTIVYMVNKQISMVMVKLDKSGQTKSFKPRDILEIVR